MSKKTPKDNIKETPPYTDWTDSYVDFYQQRRVPISKSLIIRLSKELIEWAKTDPDGFTLSGFYIEKGITRSTFHFLCDKHPELEAAKDIAKTFIARRRENGAIKNKLNTAMVIKMQHFYDEDWWKTEEKHAELKAKYNANVDKDIKYTVVLDSYKDKKEKDGK